MFYFYLLTTIRMNFIYGKFCTVWFERGINRLFHWISPGRCYSNSFQSEVNFFTVDVFTFILRLRKVDQPKSKDNGKATFSCRTFGLLRTPMYYIAYIYLPMTNFLIHIWSVTKKKLHLRRPEYLIWEFQFTLFIA